MDFPDYPESLESCHNSCLYFILSGGSSHCSTLKQAMLKLETVSAHACLFSYGMKFGLSQRGKTLMFNVSALCCTENETNCSEML